MDTPREGVSLIDAIVAAPLIVVHVMVSLLPPSNSVEIVYMLGHATSLAIASTLRECKHLLVIPAGQLHHRLSS